MTSANVTRWLAADPDPDTRAELELLDPATQRARMDETMTFGTAGLRGPIGVGPGRMNRLTVLRAAQGLADHLGPGGSVVIGYDARTKSDVFAADTASIMRRSGIEPMLFDDFVPTPVLAFAVRHFGARAGVMVTASHNPPADNGYKVYTYEGAQLLPPEADAIEAAIAARPVEPFDDLPAVEPMAAPVDAYLDAWLDATGPDHSQRRVVYTPLHGVAGPVMVRALARRGCTPHVVASQAEPDPRFPTVDFPNPEEPGALDAALALAARESADVVVANDPDGDRLAIALPTGDGWRALTGNELGVLLADQLIATTTGSDRVVATTIVSSSMLDKLAGARGVGYRETLTGFKWLVRPGLDEPGRRLIFAYEEALGYAVSPAVRDKDGISAAIAFLDLMERVGDPIAHLATLYEEVGYHASAQVSLRLDSDIISRGLDALRASPPAHVAGFDVVAVVDYSVGRDGLAPTNALRFDLADARVVIRPSGTEPKVKMYLEAVGPRADVALATLKHAASGFLPV